MILSGNEELFVGNLCPKAMKGNGNEEFFYLSKTVLIKI
jgi:hypothetical protein